MDKALIIGNYNFLGFHFCLHLLEKGYEIIGVSWDKSLNEYELEQKRMAIGRNANFHEEVLEENILPNITSPTLIVFDLYELLMKDSRDFHNSIDKIKEVIRKNTSPIQKSDSKIIFLLPIPLLNHKTDLNIGPYMDSLAKVGIQLQAYYLPTVFGSWQPKDFAFQQAILKNTNNGNDIQLSEHEWTSDAIYVEDAVNTIIEFTDDFIPMLCILRSEEENLWKKCANYLQINETNNISDEVYKRGISVKSVPSKTDYKRALELQRQHLELLAIEER